MDNSRDKLAPGVAARFKLTKERLRRDGVVFDSRYIGMEQRQYDTYEDQHKHGVHKRSLGGFDQPVHSHKTERASEHTDGIVIDGVSMSAEQAIEYRKGNL